jgi:acyl dehydratase
MQKQQKVEYHQLEAGYEFPPSRCQVDSSMVAAYLEAVEEPGTLYRDTDLVPPLAVAARVMAALSDSLSFPSGAIHVSQELEFIGTVSAGDTLSSYAKVSRKQDRGRLHLLTIDLDVFNQEKKPVLTGKTSFILPEPK